MTIPVDQNPNPFSLYLCSRKNMAKIIDGKQIAADIRSELRSQVEEWVAMGHKRPQLTAVLIGMDPASQTYVNNKMKV